ncbi:MAG: histidine kinase dimerization/phosphoacceptor domain -containing protein, partial [Chitinophagaceae bacterium]
AEEDKLVDQTDALLAKKTISLFPGDRFFTLEFELLDFEEGESSYAYMIKGVDKDWNYISENSIRISGLPYGNHTLLVKGQTHDGLWSNSELKIPLTVIRPYYLQWWFIISVAIFSTVLFVVLYKRHVHQLVNAKVKLEKEILSRTKDLADSLLQEQALRQEKDVLLKEVHHRVKNNLQVISGLLELQEKTVSDEQAKLALQQGRTRVRSIALIHQNLYQYQNLSCIEVKSFVDDLYQQVSSMYGRAASATTAHIDLPVLEIDIDTAVPFGLALNELLTNSFKYGYEPEKLFVINMSLTSEKLGFEKGNRFIFEYRDSGPGLPAGFDIARSKSLGMRLVNDLSKQMGGRLHYSFDSGSHFTIIFYDKKARKQND